MSQVQILQAPRAARRKDRHQQRNAVPLEGLAERSLAEHSDRDQQRNNVPLEGLAEHHQHRSAVPLDGMADYAAPLDGFEKQRSALLDHLVPADERAGDWEKNVLEVLGEGGACLSEL